MSTNNEQRETSNHDSDKTSPPQDRWFYTCELAFVCVCVLLCKFASPIKGVSTAILVGPLAGISVVLIIATCVKRATPKQRRSITNIWILTFLTIMAIKWCVG